MSVAVVTTTIHIPKLLQAYAENARRFGHADVIFIVIGDKKTPSGVADFCAAVARVSGYLVMYYDVAEQHRLLASTPALAEHLPYNSIQRRNIGLLQAYRDGADTIITIDDDNFVQPDVDFIGLHQTVGTSQTVPTVSSSTGWYNVCELLTEQRGIPFYHRGYPLQQRLTVGTVTRGEVTGAVAVNAGLWLGAPDVDAVTWLAFPVETTGLTHDGVSLAPGTWCPFNSQNTALARDVLPAYFLSPFIGRYDDIWASYIVKAIADHLGQLIRFGQPLVRQERNPHNYLTDLDDERFGMQTTDLFVAWLMQYTFTGSTYHECFSELVRDLNTGWRDIFSGSETQALDQVERFVQGLQIWHDVYAHELVQV